ncbi:MAG: hypothetical protein PHE72_09575 [candidate division Zixibacteria bacterium]|nr:hypothetical protein [candidate division Zixibacteria bacterium]MDM7973112.1 hypothetical protein [candidate division Zixibacteria bacterium]
MMRRGIAGWMMCLGAAGLAAGGAAAVELTPSPLEQAQVEVRYGLAAAGNLDRWAAAELAPGDTGQAGTLPGEKSPVKAMLLSLAVPGAGQWYYGSRIKPFVFLGLEALAWGLHAHYHYNGEDMTDEFEAFNREHWSQQAYADYLNWAYDGLTIKDLEDTVIPGLTHHLPDTRTQQYYEMTGKYNQFAWGWDDANLQGLMLYADYSQSNPPPKIDQGVPASPRRDKYEDMRGDANHEFKKAGRMLVGVVVNHVVSGLEAFFMTRHRNRQLRGDDEAEEFLSNLSIEPSLRSVYRFQDTPYVQVNYSF